MEAQKRALLLFNTTHLDDLCGTRVSKQKFFEYDGRKMRLICERAPEPELILWDNFGKSKFMNALL